MSSNGSHLSKEFFELVKSIGESRSKAEEDRIVMKEVTLLKAKMAKRDISPKKMKEYLIRMLYVEMLGHDASFGHIHAVKMVSTKDLLNKRVGYLAISLTLNPEHSFMLLLINSLQSDLRSDNFLDVSMALTVICKLVNIDTIPAVLPLVSTLVTHRQSNVRKKAVMCLHRFYQLDPSSQPDVDSKVRKVLCDKDPAVMAASLHFFVELIEASPNKYKDLVPSFVSILKQVTEHRLPRDFDYHRMPAPWIQLSLLRILAMLGQADQRSSEGMYEILKEVMKRADIGINIGYAIVYECIRTITTIYPNAPLIEDASMSVSRFISADNHNLKYLGVTSLAAIVQIDAKYAVDHQMTVIECLEDPDETLKRKTLDLLYRMTNPQNIVVIVGKLTQFLKQTQDIYLRTELVSRITTISEKFAPNPSWYLESMNGVFEVGGDLVRPEVANGVLRLIAENEDDDEDEESLRVFAVETYIDMLNKKVLPDILLKVIAWVLGEYGQISPSSTSTEIVDFLAAALDRPVDNNDTRAWILSAMTKQVACIARKEGAVNIPILSDIVSRYQASVDVNLQQRALELEALLANTSLLVKAMPAGKAAEDVKVDENLNFLSSYVEAAKANGAKEYQNQTQLTEFRTRTASIEDGSTYKRKSVKGLNFTAYETPQSMYEAEPELEPAAPVTETYTQESKSGLQLGGVTKTWGRNMKPAAQPKPAPQATASIDMFSQPAVEQKRPQQRETPPAQVRRQPEVAKPRELTEKERMAQSLFMGVTPATTKTTRATRKPATRKPQTRQPSKQAAAVQQPSQELDLFSMDFSEDNTQTTNAAPAQQPAAAQSDDLLSGLFSTEPTTTTSAPASTSSGGGDLDIFGMGNSSPAPASNNNGGLDIFGMAASSAPSAVGAAAMSSEAKGLLGDSVGDEKTVLKNNNAQVSVQTSYAQDGARVGVFVSNKSSNDLSQVGIAFALPPSLNANVLTSGDAKQANANLLVAIGNIAANATASIVVNLTLKSLKKFPDVLPASLTIGGKQSTVSIPLSMVDFVRPLKINTKEFGGAWKSVNKTNEMRFAANTNATNGEGFMSRMKALGLHAVQTIQSENICAGQVVGLDAKNGIVLVHGKMGTNGTVTVLVRTQDSTFTRLVAQSVQKGLRT